MNWISRPISLAVLIGCDAGRTLEFKKVLTFLQPQEGDRSWYGAWGEFVQR